MATKELIKELAIRENELIVTIEALEVELEAIRTLIGVYSTSEAKGTSEVKLVRTRINKSTTSISGVEAKGNKDWREYALILLSTFKEAKAADVVSLAINSNPKLDKKTVKNAISSHLSRLYRAKTIDATKGEYKKDGFTYKIKKEPEGS